MTVSSLRAADWLIKSLEASGTKFIFALSGNQVMSVFDALVDSSIQLIHVRHEAAAVHMADAWGRLTGEPGVALVSAGPGFANTLSALYVARMAESPLLLISGHAAHSQLGRGAFQEMAQSEMARHVTKASRTVVDAAEVAAEVTRAMRLSREARPGPVHLSIPHDVLETKIAGGSSGEGSGVDCDGETSAGPRDAVFADQVLRAVEQSKRPLILAGPAMMRGASRESLDLLGKVCEVPTIGMESPRGLNDPSLGAIAEVVCQADLLILLGKKLDFSIPLPNAQLVDPGCRVIQVDADSQVIQQTKTRIGDSTHELRTRVAQPTAFAKQLVELGARGKRADIQWSEQVLRAVQYRPPEWSHVASRASAPLHAVQVCGAVKRFLDEDTQSVLVSDGGEFGQWVQACVTAQFRLINGPSGSIGSALPMALAARLAHPDSRIVAMMGDGTFGFHALELDTAVRYKLPLIAVIGNDSAWNAELQIQQKKYGPQRAIGCSLSPTSYDQVVSGLGGHGERVSTVEQLNPALDRAHQSQLPACLNVLVDRVAAPIIRREPETA